MANFALSKNNSLNVYGWNLFGTLGLGHQTVINTPIINPFFNELNISTIFTSGSAQSWVITNESKIYVFGICTNGVFGLGYNSSSCPSILTPLLHPLFKDKDVINDLKTLHSYIRCMQHHQRYIDYHKSLMDKHIVLFYQ